jgi:hypothetical protein
VDIAELVAGFTTHERIAANRSSNWEDDQDQWLREVQRLIDKAEEMGIDKNLVISRAFNTNILSQFFAQENAQANAQNNQ